MVLCVLVTTVFIGNIPAAATEVCIVTLCVPIEKLTSLLVTPSRTGFIDKFRSYAPYVPQTAKTTRFQNFFIFCALNNC